MAVFAEPAFAARIVLPAMIPMKPSSTSPLRLLVYAGVLGVLMGTAVVYLLWGWRRRA